MARNEVGLPALYAALRDTLTRHSLDGLALAVGDPELGVQVFTAGPEAAAALADCNTHDGAWSSVPALDVDPFELELLRALARTALRLGAADREVEPATGLEVAVRSVPGVRTVMTDGACLRVVADDDAREQVIARLAALQPGINAVVVVEPPLAPSDQPAPAADVPPPARVELVAVQSQPETGELEVHLRFSDQRTVGRGPLARAGTAAAQATLDALQELGEAADYRLAWVRTVDTLPNREFLVGVSLTRPHASAVYGLAPGTSPIEAAARATLDACNRDVGRT